MEIEDSPFAHARFAFLSMIDTPATEFDAPSGQHKITEAHVNGIWNGVLQAYFPFPTFTVAPEFWTTQAGRGGSRVDLVVYRVSDGRPVFVFEGKREMNIQSVKNWKQMARYLRSLHKRHDQITYRILAGEDEYIILQYDGRNITRVAERSLLGDGNFHTNSLLQGRNETNSDAILKAIAIKMNK
ncbi:hypothetical protein N7462_002610 [Penicillium macrosclerotiorum]|uniref:uncharacterized protein n=1 Tax=Penicillium macrosclerotiorum TaxID=303699 RepID=UPI002548710F|nr:uncharacterized protein N7462_002610 [Penicillium macrosclerotiorum]KAJ5693187.1 hypothetical protein N7462_002610 [Penicillium macrosclerotiorum]